MPYRRAHWYVAGLIVIAAVGFWRDYFAALSEAEWSWHFHGITASLWIVLVALQSWTITTRRVPLHRTLGKSSLILFPLFFAGSAAVVHAMAAATSPAHPFYKFWGAPLGTVDALATIAIGWLFYEALRLRRDVQKHARLMLATPLFLVLPALGRVFTHYVPGLRIDGPPDFWMFRWDTHLANILTILFTLAHYRQSPRHGRAFAVSAAVMVAQGITFETVGTWEIWQRAFMAFGQLPALGVVVVATGVGAAITWAGWTAPRRPGRPATPATVPA